MVIKFVVVVAYLIAGSAQLLQAKPIVDQFREFGLPMWTVLAVGLFQVVGAIGLLVGATALPTAVGLTLVMVGAVAYHIRAKHPASKIAPAFLLLVFTSYLAYTL